MQPIIRWKLQMQPTSRRPQSLAGPGAHGVLSSWVFVASLVVAMLGLCVMVGWLLGRESLEGIAPGLSMVVVTASGITVVAVLGARAFCRSHIAHHGQDGGGEPSLVMVQFVDTSDRRHLEEQVAQLGSHDSLTGLLNRRSFETALSSHVAYCSRYGPAGAVLMLDLDGFDRVNETHGPDVGDQLVVTTAHLIQQRVRASDLVARLSGEHFVVLLPAGHGAGARAVAQILVEEIHSYPAAVTGGHIPLSVSIGVAVFDDVERSADEMLVNAGLAMFDAMDLGGDRWTQFASETYGQRAFRPVSHRSTVVVE